MPARRSFAPTFLIKAWNERFAEAKTVQSTVGVAGNLICVTTAWAADATTYRRLLKNSKAWNERLTEADAVQSTVGMAVHCKPHLCCHCLCSRCNYLQQVVEYFIGHRALLAALVLLQPAAICGHAAAAAPTVAARKQFAMIYLYISIYNICISICIYGTVSYRIKECQIRFKLDSPLGMELNL